MRRPRWRGRLRALGLCGALLACSWSLLSSCQWPRVKLPVRGDSDDDDDDDDVIIACNAAMPCTHPTLKLCGPVGICVECLGNADCERGVCDEGECESPFD